MLWFLIITTLGVFVYTIYRILTRNTDISHQAEFVNLILGITKPKKSLIRVFMNPPRANSPLKASKKFASRYDTVYRNIDGTEIITAKPIKPIGVHIVYLHGGAYVLGKNGFKGHESFVSNLVIATGAKVSFIDYPVAPESKYRETLECVNKAYSRLVEEYSNDRFILIGDSAGGGLALSLAQIIANRKNIKQPEKIVLYSPWLDLSLDNPEIVEHEKNDMILSREALLYAATQYAEKDFKDPMVSPLYGDFTGLGPILMFFSSSELFYPDGLRMKKIADTNNHEIQFKFYPLMPHDWVIFQIPEAEKALRETQEFLTK